MPLVIDLAPNEKFLLNGALFQVGDRRVQITMLSEGVRLLRGEMVLDEHDITTPLRKLQYALQRAYAGTADEQHRGSFEFGKHSDEARSGGDADLIALLDAIDHCMTHGEFYPALQMLHRFRMDAERSG
jgi:flagellar biosynthesis repressor protein FlbT